MNTVLFEVPPLAVDAARREVCHLGERIANQLESVIPAILDGQDSAFNAAQAGEQLIDAHHAAIVAFVEKLLQPEMPRDLCRTAIDLVEAADYLESIGDVVDREMVSLYRRHVERGTLIGAQAREHLRALAEAINRELQRALRAVADADQSLAQAVLDTKPMVRSLERAAVDFQIEPQISDDAQRMLPNAFERELTESLRRIYSLVRRFVRAGTDLLRADIDDSEPD